MNTLFLIHNVRPELLFASIRLRTKNYAVAHHAPRIPNEIIFIGMQVTGEVEEEGIASI